MIIDEVIEHCKRTTSKYERAKDYNKIYGEHKLVAEWLEELKRRKEYDKEIMGSGVLNNAYNQALNDFSKKMINLNTLNCFQLYVADEIDLEELMNLASDEIVKGLKKGE